MATPGKCKTPYFITLTKSHPFAFAGIWEHRAELVSCAIITTAANAAVRPVHHRMPVMLTEASEYEQWLSPIAHMKNCNVCSDRLRVTCSFIGFQPWSIRPAMIRRPSG